MERRILELFHAQASGRYGTFEMCPVRTLQFRHCSTKYRPWQDASDDAVAFRRSRLAGHGKLSAVKSLVTFAECIGRRKF